MKTYTVDADGVPALAFRAKDDDAAAAWLTGWVGKWYAGTFAARNKALTVRPATIPEQAAWRAQSVRMQCEFMRERPAFRYFNGGSASATVT